MNTIDRQFIDFINAQPSDRKHHRHGTWEQAAPGDFYREVVEEWGARISFDLLMHKLWRAFGTGHRNGATIILYGDITLHDSPTLMDYLNKSRGDTYGDLQRFIAGSTPSHAANMTMSVSQQVGVAHDKLLPGIWYKIIDANGTYHNQICVATSIPEGRPAPVAISPDRAELLPFQVASNLQYVQVKHADLTINID